MPNESSPLNPHQRRRLLVTCQHIDKMLSDMERALSDTASKRVFPEHIPDVSPAHRALVEDYISRLRNQLALVLKRAEIRAPNPATSASHALITSVNFIEVEAEELSPEFMKGYGELTPAAAQELESISGELRNLAIQLRDCLTVNNQSKVTSGE